eukprot:9671161-Prorocentrum_lima.AAC.1
MSINIPLVDMRSAAVTADADAEDFTDAESESRHVDDGRQTRHGGISFVKPNLDMDLMHKPGVRTATDA